MKNEEILEGNKLIAEFMGYEHDTPEDEIESVTYYCDDFLVNISELEDWNTTENDWTSYLLPKEMKFHSNWSWLMKVVEKISMMNHNNPNGQRYIFNTNRCVKHNLNELNKPIKIRIKGVYMNLPHPFIEVDSFNEKEGTFQAVVEFIKWYNENKLN